MHSSSNREQSGVSFRRILNFQNRCLKNTINLNLGISYCQGDLSFVILDLLREGPLTYTEAQSNVFSKNNRLQSKFLSFFYSFIFLPKI